MKLDESKKNKIFFILILGIIALSIYLIYFINSNSYKCMNNPASYFVSGLEQSNNATVYCNCIMTKNINTQLFSLDKSGISFNKTYSTQMKGG